MGRKLEHYTTSIRRKLLDNWQWNEPKLEVWFMECVFFLFFLNFFYVPVGFHRRMYTIARVQFPVRVTNIALLRCFRCFYHHVFFRLICPLKFPRVISSSTYDVIGSYFRFLVFAHHQKIVRFPKSLSLIWSYMLNVHVLVTNTHKKIKKTHTHLPDPWPLTPACCLCISCTFFSPTIAKDHYKSETNQTVLHFSLISHFIRRLAGPVTSTSAVNQETTWPDELLTENCTLHINRRYWSEQLNRGDEAHNFELTEMHSVQVELGQDWFGDRRALWRPWSRPNGLFWPFLDHKRSHLRHIKPFLHSLHKEMAAV